MSAYVLWMDSSVAKIFHIKGEEVTKEQAFREEPHHHTHSPNDHKQKDSHKFFDEVADHLKSTTDAVLLCGPGVAKKHFLTYLEDHHQKPLAQRIVGTEDMDHPTDPQLIAFAKGYFPKPS